MSSKSKASTTQTTNTSTEDSRVAADGGSIVITNDSEATFVDPGAVALASEVVDRVFLASEELFEFGSDVIFDSLGFVEKNVRETNQIVETAQEQTRGEETQLISQFIKYGIPAAALVLIVRSMK